MEEIHLAHMPPELAVYMTYFSDVENAPFLREQLLAGNTDYEFAFIDADTIVSRKHVLAATWRAMNDYLNDRLKSRNVHSEIVFALSPNNNIGEAFRRFGIGEYTKNLVVIKITTSPTITFQRVSNHLAASIEGQQSNLSDTILAERSDMARIRKVYKLGSATPKSKTLVNGSAPNSNATIEDIEVQVLGMMALRGAA